MEAVRVEDLIKTYKNVVALNQISLQVEKCEIFGLIGPDGAGKTSLFRILASLLVPDSGSVSIFGYDPVKDYRNIRKITGYMPGRFALYQDLSVEENINFFATIFGVRLKDNYDIIKDIYSQLEPYRKRRAGKLSGGMKQKLALSCALIHRPEILILDEPTTGVDAVSRKEFWDILKNLKSLGITILVSTPYMDEAALCDRIALIQNGTLLDVNTPGNINMQFDRDIYSIVSGEKHALVGALNGYEHTYSAYSFGDSIHYVDKRDAFQTHELLEYLHSNSIGDAEIKKISPTIEDTFIYLMERENAGRG